MDRDGTLRVNCGAAHGLKPRTYFIITRNSQFIAVAVVTKTAERSCRAQVIPEFRLQEVRPGDSIRIAADPIREIGRENILRLDARMGREKMMRKIQAWKRWKENRK